MHGGVVQHLPRPDEGVDHLRVHVGGGAGRIVVEDVVRRLRLGEEPQLCRRRRVTVAAAADAVGAHLIGGGRGRRGGLLAARRRVAERRREQGGRAGCRVPADISREKPVRELYNVNLNWHLNYRD